MEPTDCKKHYTHDYCERDFNISIGQLAPDVNVKRALDSLCNFFNENYIESPDYRGRWRKIALNGNLSHLTEHMHAVADITKNHGDNVKEVLRSNLVNIAARALCALQLFEEEEFRK